MEASRPSISLGLPACILGFFENSDLAGGLLHLEMLGVCPGRLLS